MAKTAHVDSTMGHHTLVQPDDDDYDNVGDDGQLEYSSNSRRILTLDEVNALTQVRGEDDHEEQNALYRSGIAALRSSAHRVKAKHRPHNPNPKTTTTTISTKAGTTILVNQTTTTTTTTNQSHHHLPAQLYNEQIIPFDMQKYNLRKCFTSILKNCDPNIVGRFIMTDNTHDDDDDDDDEEALENFILPTNTLHRKVNGGCCESAQSYMSDAVAADAEFLTVFDRLVEEVVLPHLKQRLIDAGVVVAATTTTTTSHDNNNEQPITFYVQRPPTLRLQPGPGRVGVKPHHDGEYGHQNGELNFWLPLTDRNLSGVDLWCESSFQKGDYHPLVVQLGEMVSFHGSSCRHFVNRNSSNKTRVSMDFRVGMEGFFDPYWQMNGTTDDHGRREVKL